MHDTAADTPPDRRPAIVICAYGVGDDVWDPIEDLSGQPWCPPGARTVVVDARDAENLAEALAEQVRQPACRAVLLVGRTHKSDAFRLQIRAENRDLNGTRLFPTGPAVARATAPAAEIVMALNDVGLNADATSDSEEDEGSYLLYRVLMTLPDMADAPSIGLLRAPSTITGDVLQKGVKTVATVMARHLSPLPRNLAQV